MLSGKLWKEAQMVKVLTLGEVLVEVMAEDLGEGFRKPLRLVGPFPSGAPAIFIDQVAKLNQPCGIIACVGDDDFGWLNVTRLANDGVDTKGIEVRPGAVTGSAFVRYRQSGGRDFLFNIRDSASGQVRLTDEANQMLAECGHLHISGSSLFSRRLIEMTNEAVSRVKANGGSVSFDPNVRSDVAADPEMRSVFRNILKCCDTFLPSGPELTLLTDTETPDAAITEILAMGVSRIVVKRGAQGASCHSPLEDLTVPGYHVEEVDSTGAGDCFDATFVACQLQGRSVQESLDYANAAGALACRVRGPMEGTSTFAQLDELRLATPQRCPRKLDALLPSAGGSPAHELRGITSVCSAHPLVLEAAMLQAAVDDLPVLIEATCNQVNHQGGYTGLTPAAFRDQVYGIAERVRFPRQRIVLGGDHLGPSPWRHLPAERALEEAETMVAAYLAAGYEKIHLDCSMGCQDEPERLPDAITAERAARLAAVAERAAVGARRAPRYVVGTEVPTPGGARHEITALEVTDPDAVLATLETHRQAFASRKAGAAFDRVIAVVVQPGVEFDNQNVVVYEPERARRLSGTLTKLPGLVFEAHSTDYQPVDSLANLVRDGFSILKVGPGLTFAMREALYGLDHIAALVDPSWREHSLMATMEDEMVTRPDHWRAYYQDGPSSQQVLRHFSYSDRIRYYWASPRAEEAVQRLFRFLGDSDIPRPLVSQFLPNLYERVASGAFALTPRALVLEAVRDLLRRYATACGPVASRLR